MKRLAARLLVLAIPLAMLPFVAQGQTWEGAPAGPVNDHDPREEAERKKLQAQRAPSFVRLARVLRKDSRHAAEYRALASQARMEAEEALRRAAEARSAADKAYYMAHIETPDKWREIMAARERAAEMWTEDAALWEQEAEIWDHAAIHGTVIDGVLRLCPPRIESPDGLVRRRSAACKEIAMR